MPRKPTLCLDFDGVIHRYSKGWQDGSIYDELTEGFAAWAVEAKQHFKLVVYSSRSKDHDQRTKMIVWLTNQLIKSGLGISIANFDFAYEKPAAFLTIDDRCMQFRGRWDYWWMEPKQLLEFKPWTADAKDTGCDQR